MPDETISVSLEEFASNVEGFFKRVAEGHETVVVENEEGQVIIVQPEANGREGTRRKRTAADHEAFLSAAGSWSDFDLDTFLKNLYESRMSSRPPVDL